MGGWEVLDKTKLSAVPTEVVEGSSPRVRQCGLSPTLWPCRMDAVWSESFSSKKDCFCANGQSVLGLHMVQ